MKKVRLLALPMFAALLALLLLSMVGTTSAHAAPAHSITKAVTGTVQNGGKFSGAYTITKFTSQGSRLFAVGTLSGTLTNASGQTIGNVTNQAVSVPVTNATASCSILNLALGTLNLNLLGLNVHLDPVNLVISAIPGAGNLLGNLLCAVTHLLDGGALPGSLSALLNQILSLL